MKPIAELSYTARFAVIHSNMLDKTITIEETASRDYAEKIIISSIKEAYMQSSYFCLFVKDKGMIVLDRNMHLIAMVVLIAIHRRKVL